MTPSLLIQRGNMFPYDAPDKWWSTSGGPSENPPPPPVDWAHSAARGIIKELTDRGGLESSLEQLSEDIRAEIVGAMAEIIRTAKSQKDNPPSTDVKHSTLMAEQIYGVGIEKALSTLRSSLYKEVGNLLVAQAKGAVIPPEITVSNVRIPLNPVIQ